MNAALTFNSRYLMQFDAVLSHWVRRRLPRYVFQHSSCQPPSPRTVYIRSATRSQILRRGNVSRSRERVEHSAWMFMEPFWFAGGEFDIFTSFRTG